MNLQEFLEKKGASTLIIISALLLAVVFLGPLVIDRVANKVIDRLQKQYAPGPYAPGFDPDQVDPNLWQQQKVTQQLPQAESNVPLRALQVDKPISAWEAEWERSRLISQN